jgi:hypothetical protein
LSDVVEFWEEAIEVFIGCISFGYKLGNFWRLFEDASGDILRGGILLSVIFFDFGHVVHILFKYCSDDEGYAGEDEVEE